MRHGHLLPEPVSVPENGGSITLNAHFVSIIRRFCHARKHFAFGFLGRMAVYLCVNEPASLPGKGQMEASDSQRESGRLKTNSGRKGEER